MVCYLSNRNLEREVIRIGIDRVFVYHMGSTRAPAIAFCRSDKECFISLRAVNMPDSITDTKTSLAEMLTQRQSRGCAWDNHHERCATNGGLAMKHTVMQRQYGHVRPLAPGKYPLNFQRRGISLMSTQYSYVSPLAAGNP